MKLAVVSDTHDHTPLLRGAVRDALAAGAQAFVHCGDIVAASALHSLGAGEVPMHVIHGNNLGDPFALAGLANGSVPGVQYYGQDADLELGGRRVFVVHYPHYARAMAATGDYDLVCCGHTHAHGLSWQPNLKGGLTPVLNPGTTGGVGSAPTFAMVDLATLGIEFLEVNGPGPRPPA